MPRQKTNTRQKPQKRKSDPALSVWEHLRVLYSSKRFDDVILLFEVLNVAKRNNQDDIPERLEDLETYYDVANAYLKTRRYAQAEYMFKVLIDMFPLPKQSAMETNINVESDFSEEAIRFTYHECLLNMRRHVDSYAVLTSIDAKEYEPQVRMAIANVLESAKRRKCKDDPQCAVWNPPSFDENGIKTCSSSIGSISYILSNKINQVKDEKVLPDSFIELFAGIEKNDIQLWLTAQEQIGLKHPKKAIECLKKMSHQHPRILLECARLYYNIGRKDEARRLMQIIQYKDPRWVDGMDMLAFLYSEDQTRFEQDLEKLSTQLMQFWPDRPETCTTLGFMSSLLHWNTALQYSIRALNSSVNNSEQQIYACLSKAKMLHKKKRHKEAIETIKAHIIYDNANLELHTFIIDLLTENDEYRDAQNIITELISSQPNNIHAKLLNVHFLITTRQRTRDTSNFAELVRSMEDLMKSNKNVIGATMILLDAFYKVNQNEKCAKLMDLITKHKKLMSNELKSLYHRLKSTYYLRYHRPVAAYQYLVAAMALGAEVPHSTMTEYEVEFRINGQSDLDRQLDPQTSEETVITIDDEPSSPSTSSPACVYNLRSRQSTSLHAESRPTTSSTTTSVFVRTAVPVVTAPSATAGNHHVDIFAEGNGENENNVRRNRVGGGGGGGGGGGDEEEDDEDEDDDDDAGVGQMGGFGIVDNEEEEEREPQNN